MTEPCAGATTSFSTTVDAALAEAIIWPKGESGRLFVTGIFNWLEASRPVISLGQGEALDAPGYLTRYRMVAAGAHWMVARNVRLMGETNWDVDRQRMRLVGGVVAAF